MVWPNGTNCVVAHGERCVASNNQAEPTVPLFVPLQGNILRALRDASLFGPIKNVDYANQAIPSPFRRDLWADVRGSYAIKGHALSWLR